MKRVSNIYYKVYDIDNISKMCDLVCSKVRNKEKAEKFMLYKTEHIINIRNKLISKNLILLVNNNYIDEKTFYKWLSSYNGLLKYGNCKNLYYTYFKL